MNFQGRRGAALAQLAHIAADAQLLRDILDKVKDVRGGNDWHGWARNIEHAYEDLRAAVAEVTRNAVV